VLMRAAPLPGWVYMVARFATAMLFGVAALGLLFGVAASVGGIELDLATWLSLGARLLMGAAPFVALGFAIAYLAGPSAAPAVANLLFIGMAFASGMLVPLDQLPGTVRSVAPLLPTYHYTELAWGALGVAQDSTLVSAVWLIGFALGLFGLATFAYRRETRRAFA
jgi:ABC-2 type transport system permease protein